MVGLLINTLLSKDPYFNINKRSNKILTDNCEKLLISTRNLVLVPTLEEISLSLRRKAGGSFSLPASPLTRNSMSLVEDPDGDRALIVYIPASLRWISSRASWIVFPATFVLRRGIGVTGAPSLNLKELK